VTRYGGNYEPNGYTDKLESGKSFEVCRGGAAMRLNRLIISIVVAVVLSVLPSSASSEVTCCSPPNVISCDADGTPKEEFVAGESVYITATGLRSNGWHYVIIQDHLVGDGDLFNISEDPSEAWWHERPWTKVDFFVTNSSGCSESPILIWGSIPHGNQKTYDIVVNAFGILPFLTYNDSIDGLDSVGVSGGGGFLAPVPELPTIILTAIGLIGAIALGRRR